jgi:hypothetical protein
MTISREHRWAELSAVTQAALRCKDPVFWAFLRESGFDRNSIKKIEDEETAAEVVRYACEIESRRELANDLNAQAIWHDLDNLYQAWLARER